MARSPKDQPATVEELSEQIEVLKAELADLASGARAQGEAVARDLTERGRATLDQLRDAAGQQAARARDSAGDYLQRAEGALHRNPATAMGLAVGAGFLIGLLLARR